MATFFTFEQHRRRYECRIDFRGPYLVCSRHIASFGVSALRHFGHIEWRSIGSMEVADEIGARTWCIVKNDHERAIELPAATTREDALKLGAELGLPLWESRMNSKVKAEVFYSSPPFLALRTWVKAYPAAARGFAKDGASRRYLPDWYERAIAPLALRQRRTLRLVHSR
jgi:hypothetical protein